MPKITLTHADTSEDKYALQGGFFTVGRANDTDINLRDDASSGYHAVLKRLESGDFTVVDLGSTNTTRVNGRRIVEPHRLQDGDRILFGDTLAIYESEIPASARPADGGSPEVSGSGGRTREPRRAPRSKRRRAMQAAAAAAAAAPSAPNQPTPSAVTPAPSGGGCLGLVVAAIFSASLLLGAVLAGQ